jgi:hypothetical protein
MYYQTVYDALKSMWDGGILSDTLHVFVWLTSSAVIFDGQIFFQTKHIIKQTNRNKLGGFSPRANYTDRATTSCRRS